MTSLTKITIDLASQRSTDIDNHSDKKLSVKTLCPNFFMNHLAM